MRSSIVLGILGLLAGGLCTKVEVCQLRAERACRPYSVLPNQFPGTLQDLRKDCLELPKVNECFAASMGNCSLAEDADVDDGDRLRMKETAAFMRVIRQICNENSELHQNFVPYLSCLKSSLEVEFEKQACPDYENRADDFLRGRIRHKARMASEDEGGADRVRREITNCLRMLLHLNCLVVQLTSACGAGVQRPILTILKGAVSVDVQCPVASRIDVIELLDALRLVSTQQIYVRNLLVTESLL